MMLGFGSTELRFEAQLEDKVRELVKVEFKRQRALCFTNKFICKIKEEIDCWGKDSVEESNRFGTSQSHPDRYSYYWPYVSGDANCISFNFRIHHINRRHALANDGWGLMLTELNFYIFNSEMRKMTKEGCVKALDMMGGE